MSKCSFCIFQISFFFFFCFLILSYCHDLNVNAQDIDVLRLFNPQLTPNDLTIIFSELLERSQTLITLTIEPLLMIRTYSIRTY